MSAALPDVMTMLTAALPGVGPTVGASDGDAAFQTLLSDLLDNASAPTAPAPAASQAASVPPGGLAFATLEAPAPAADDLIRDEPELPGVAVDLSALTPIVIPPVAPASLEAPTASAPADAPTSTPTPARLPGQGEWGERPAIEIAAGRPAPRDISAESPAPAPARPASAPQAAEHLGLREGAPTGVVGDADPAAAPRPPALNATAQAAFAPTPAASATQALAASTIATVPPPAPAAATALMTVPTTVVPPAATAAAAVTAAVAPARDGPVKTPQAAKTAAASGLAPGQAPGQAPSRADRAAAATSPVTAPSPNLAAAGAPGDQPALAPNSELAAGSAPEPLTARDEPRPPAPMAAQVPVLETEPVRAETETVATLAAQIVRKAQGRASRFDLQLAPEGMGRVDVSLEIAANGKITAALSFDNPQACAELRARSGELTRLLEQAGFEVAGGLSFETSGDARGGREQPGPHPGQQDANPNSRGRAFLAALETADDADLLAFSPSTFQRAAASGVDVRV